MSAIVMTDRIRSLRAVVFAALCVALAATAHVIMGGVGVSMPVLAGAFGAVLILTWLLAGRRRGLGAISAWMIAAQSTLHLLFEQAGTFAPDGGGLGRHAGTDWAALLLCNPGRVPAGVSPADLARMAGLDPDVPPAAGLRAMSGLHHGAGAGTGTGTASVPGDGMAMDMAGMPGMSSVSGASDATGHAVASPGMAAHDVTTHGIASHSMVHGMSLGMISAHVLAALACVLLLWRGDAALVRLFELLGTLRAVVAGALLLPLLALFARPLGYRPPTPPRPTDRRTRLPRQVLLTHAVVRRGPPALALAC
ncbi:hypothetical protein F7Q99_22780 [Streptomyces kaniharaensis]|uniref:PE-PGRS family protein n=1 Tax=Streptomyces kaniharaensis TaxID=212423 RepID=A0A6N7KWM3_9ACTN|nr:hypothetical protein [Streptomyces kaniharaensis]MQS15009.1 hypothetical protein [Streptomyces kaniharaensis]